MEVLRTARLRLRWFQEDDATFVLALLNEPGWIRHIADAGVRTLPQAQQWMHERLMTHYWSKGHGFWAVERLTDGVLIGLCGLFKRDALQHPDVGYGFLAAYGGQGYAREAAAACLRYAHEVLGMRRVQAITSPGNERSMHLLRALGMQDLGKQAIEGYPEPEQLFEWQDPAPEPSDTEQVQQLLGRFLSAFDNRDGRLPQVAAVPYWMLPSAVIHLVQGDHIKAMTVREFAEPRAVLLSSASLQNFHEWAVEQRIDIHGALAHVWLRYAKSGLSNCEPYQGQGTKTLQLHKGPAGWKIAALAWADDA